MAVKVGNSWVSEAAYSYAQAKMNKTAGAEDKGNGSVLHQLSDKYADINFNTNTQPYSGTGKNNVSIAPNILKEMDCNPDKRLEYEALIYDCNEVIKNMPGKTVTGGAIKSFGFIINADGSLGSWSISESGGNRNRNQCALDKNNKNSWMDIILGKRQQKLRV